MKTSISPWRSRFDSLLDEDEIERRTRISPPAVRGLKDLPPESASVALGHALGQIFVPTRSAVRIIKGILCRASEFSAREFPDERSYLRLAYSKQEEGRQKEAPIQCITGLSGVGKSELLAAIGRAMPVDEMTACVGGHNDVRMRACWSTHMAPSGDMLRSLCGSTNSRESIEMLLVACTNVSRKDAISTIVIDEAQFLGVAESSCNQITKTLIDVSRVGVPVVFAANYSLCHQFLRRADQDRQRLLRAPTVLLPDPPGSDDWLEYMSECCRVSGGALKLDTHSASSLCYNFSFGIKRLVVALLETAYLIARNRGELRVQEEHLRLAFADFGFSLYRQTIERLVQNEITASRTRLDLVCPFELPATSRSEFREHCRTEQERRIADAMLNSSLTVTESKAIGQIRNEESSPGGIKLSEKAMRKSSRASVSDINEATARLKDKFLKKNEDTK